MIIYQILLYSMEKILNAIISLYECMLNLATIMLLFFT